MIGEDHTLQKIAPIFSIHEDTRHLFLTNSVYLIAIPNTFPFTKIGPIWIQWQNSWRHSADYFELKYQGKPITFISAIPQEYGSNVKYLLLKSKEDIDVEIAIYDEKNFLLITFPSTKTNKTIEIDLIINFDRTNSYDYINLSGNLYKRVKNPLKKRLQVPYTGSFSQVWSIHSKSCFSGLALGIKPITAGEFKANFHKNHVSLSIEMKTSPENASYFFILLGYGNHSLPIQTKFTEIDPIKPLPLKYKDRVFQEALKSFRALSKYFLLETPHGAVPANFIFPPENEADSFQKLNFGSFGNCFSLGFIYGTSSLYNWVLKTERERGLQNNVLKRLDKLRKKKNRSPYDSELSIEPSTILQILNNKFLPPILKGAQLKSGPMKGAFFDTYNGVTKRWTTGRVQFPEGGYSDWFPYPPDRKGNAGQAIITFPKREIGIGGLSYLLSTALFTLQQTIKTIPFLFKRIPKRVIYPAYTGQFAYFLLQTLESSLAEKHYLGSSIEKELIQTLNLTSNFLQEYQRNDHLWDHEIFEDGSVYWAKRTLACIYPATFLYSWGIHTENDDLKAQALKAIHQCNRLLNRGEYYGLYFETNLALNQDDLVTGLACIKCYTRLYKLTGALKYLNNARIAAWHILSYMWGNNIYDRLNNPITGGIPVTTYKSLGYPVIGGSELCQTIDALFELALFDSIFFRFGLAALTFHSNYLYESNRYIGATHEIIWGIGENWSTSTSADFASYATGPLIHALYLYANQPTTYGRYIHLLSGKAISPPQSIIPLSLTSLPSTRPPLPPAQPPVYPPTETPICIKCYQMYLNPNICLCGKEVVEKTRKDRFLS